MVKLFLSKSLIDKCESSTKKLLDLKRIEISFSKELFDEIRKVGNILNNKTFENKKISGIVTDIFFLLNTLEKYMDELTEEVYSPSISDCKESISYIKEHLKCLKNLKKLCDDEYIRDLSNNQEKNKGYVKFESLSSLQKFLDLLDNLKKAHISSKDIEKEMSKLSISLDNLEKDAIKKLKGKKNRPLSQILACKKELAQIKTFFEYTLSEIEEIKN
ncbi:MAG: hypothetical protein V1859_01025 [archaeon]